MQDDGFQHHSENVCVIHTKITLPSHSKKCFVYTFSDDFHLHHFPNNNFEVLSCPSIKTALFEKLFHFSFRGYPNSFIYNVSFQKKPSLNLSCNTFLHDYLNKSNITDLKSKRIANWPKYYKIGQKLCYPRNISRYCSLIYLYQM